MKNIVFVFSMLMAAVISSDAQESTATLALPNAYDKKMISLNDFNSLAGVAVVFYSNECPYDNYYKERLRVLIETYGAKIQFLLVNANQEPAEAVEKMAIHYSDLKVPYLADKDQVLMNMLGARKSPEVFLLKNDNGKQKPFYQGAIDDNAQVEKDVSSTFLKTAIEQLLANGAAPENNRAVGCTVRKK